MDECFERIDALLRKQGKSQADLIKYLGLSHGTYNHWKNGRNRSYRIHLRKIAQFFHVPVSYFGNEFIDENETPDQYWPVLDMLSPEELSIIKHLRKMGTKPIHQLDLFLKDVLQSSL